MTLLVILSALCFSLFSSVHCACYLLENKQDLSVFGFRQSYCEVNGFKVLPGSKIVTPDCNVCKCYEDALKCCGFGKNLPRIDYVGEEDCDHVTEFCYQYAVKKNDHSLDCRTGLPFQRHLVKEDIANMI